MNLPSLGPRGEGWLVGQLVLFFAVGLVSGATGTPNETVALWAGLVFIAAGFLIGAWGIVALGGNLSVFPRPKGGAALVDQGIYALIRHPIYAGQILIAVGVSLARLSLPGLALSVALAVFLDLKARREEALLAARYPGYAEYARRTSRFIPGIY